MTPVLATAAFYGVVILVSLLSGHGARKEKAVHPKTITDA